MNYIKIDDPAEDIMIELASPVEQAARELRTIVIAELIQARHEQGISQKKLEELSGVKQAIIARMEKESTSPQIDTILKVLVPLGKTLAVVPIEERASDNLQRLKTYERLSKYAELAKKKE